MYVVNFKKITGRKVITELFIGRYFFLNVAVPVYHFKKNVTQSAKGLFKEKS